MRCIIYLIWKGGTCVANFKVGDKIKFAEEKQRYTVKAVSGRYLIYTKPFNLIKHCLYTIVDFKRNVRGTNDRIDYMIQEDIDRCLDDLLKGNVDVSRRNCVPLNIEGGETCVNT